MSGPDEPDEPGADGTEGKVVTLGTAVQRLVRPGMALHLGYGGGRPNAAIAEIIRRFAGSSPGFTVSAHGFVNTQHALLAAGLVRRLVVAFAGENYPSPRPNPILQRALRDGIVEIENWSLWSLTARLMAGALGLPFMPVRSLAGSGMGDEHLGRDFELTSAFGSDPVGVVSALRPDLVLVQGLAADPSGNVILAPPYGEGAWGALAARSGVLACVERIVDDAYIRRHNTLPMIPAHAVRAVCHVPYGSHPYGMDPGALPGPPGYGEDEAFMDELRAAAKSSDGIAEWISRWVTSVPDHASFLDRLGATRLAALREGPAAPAEPAGGEPSADERMTLAAVRVLRERIVSAGHDAVLAGIGYSHLAAWTAVQRLREEGVAVDLLAELGMAGFVPQAGDPYLFARQNFATCLRLTDVLDVLGRDVSGPGTSAIGVLGAGQIDQRGDINSTWSPAGDYIVGSGGANDVATAAREVIAVVKHSPRRLIEKVGYVTAPGERVSTIVTSEAVFSRRDGDFVLTRLLPGASAESVRARTGWSFAVAPDLAPEPEPSAADLALVRSYDPKSVFLSRGGS